MDKIAISVIPGLFLVFTYRILETISYLSNSGTNVIEKIVINLIYILGFAVPRFLIWEKLKYGVSLVSKDVAGHFDTEWFQEFQSTMSVLEQIALAYVWDSVRASSQCIQLNNCGANDFLEHLTRMKISVRHNPIIVINCSLKLRSLITFTDFTDMYRFRWSINVRTALQ